ncbi:hypothetical protein G7B40_037800 [Aetokthonos hydrillicola Thurmond2011]|jgi:hypothetical protein|uniref:3'-5' exonuclease domain-containing protein n=1 Tax=Aetokthonos hydrillicola Thurmond2011 TaxID=2712845 RepID=A0AAP5IEN1_9CYAN|nr:hypothetical protein [Aetokthonos hydrillicola]MBO3463276.1 hypothetical protein [Aetokthonos hydrillicola CCALA 1050]MBW4589767.1 hypothetical protein [Aetokthonos hydrillicola CCALA 1050]MDR9900263.1 hypothetical protein [Aetokthonos hydrillicola Thurmond2011]
MSYLTNSADILYAISELTTSSKLWIDTEIADWRTHARRLSLIQVLSDTTSPSEDHVLIFDVLNKPDVIKLFSEQIIANSTIEKIFHNAPADLRLLGKDQAKNITCTLKIARQMNDVLNVTNFKLKTLAVELCHASDVDTEQGTSDWGYRPLNPKQLLYARRDVIYLAQVHHHLLQIVDSHQGSSKKYKYLSSEISLRNPSYTPTEPSQVYQDDQSVAEINDFTFLTSLLLADSHSFLVHEEFLDILRQLYRCDTEYREKITQYANNFKSRGYFFREELNFLIQRLNYHQIDCAIGSEEPEELEEENSSEQCVKTEVSYKISYKEILETLRQLYELDTQYRETIVRYVDNFKSKKYFLSEELTFLTQRLKYHRIDCQAQLFPLHRDLYARPWSSEEDERLRLRYSQQAPINIIAAEFQRSKGAIRSRIKKLGLQDQHQQSSYNTKIQEIRKQYPRAYEPWSGEEDKQLRLRYSQNAPINIIAAEFQRQPSAIRSRLEKLGLRS